MSYSLKVPKNRFGEVVISLWSLKRILYRVSFRILLVLCTLDNLADSV